MSKSVRILFEPLSGQASAAFLPYELDVRLGQDLVIIKGHFAPHASGGAFQTHELAVVPDHAELLLKTPDARLALLVED